MNKSWEQVSDRVMCIIASVAERLDISFEDVNHAAMDYKFPDFATEEDWDKELEKFKLFLSENLERGLEGFILNPL